MRDPYTVLGVPRTASEEELKRAYHRLAKRLHPDLNPGKPGIEQQFKEVTAAYEILSDPAQRQRFDRGEIDAGGNERMRGFHPRGGARNMGAEEFSMDEVFAEFFGHGARRPGGARPGGRPSDPPPAQRLRISFLEAARGGKRRVDLASRRSVDVTIPAGIEPGQKLRLRGAEGADIFFEIEVEPHSVYTRKLRDIHSDLPVTLVEAALGATITVPTIHGAVALKIAAGSNSGAVLRLKGKGIAAADGAGDHYVKLQVMLPDPPDPELTRFLESWGKAHPYDVRRKLDQA